MNKTLHIDGKPVTLEKLERKGQEIAFVLGGKSYRFCGSKVSCADFILERCGADGVLQRLSGMAWQGRGVRHVQLGALEATVSEMPKSASHATVKAGLSPFAPMPGLVRQIMVKKGDKVKEGQPLIVMEAMKLQTTLAAGGNGVVEAVLVKEGQMVAEGAELVRIKAEQK